MSLASELVECSQMNVVSLTEAKQDGAERSEADEVKCCTVGALLRAPRVLSDDFFHKVMSCFSALDMAVIP